ncbi:Uncharacterised protein [Mycolicibacterium vanbaalenii]|uniref:Uncharacterized protein n=1 Tax=Mycolicibacterium vanbaalenii TaxID=110539 RepID=A0A5S9R611_MYCVN|nr:hypothetical protein [Mycolicibacterium vanbaalenii]CAA0129303.1 Uncharacterised protein [Mycolicibacterium vanbaalenii]
MREIHVVTGHRHRLQAIGIGDDRRWRIICPDGGQNCECWIECQEAHPCNCGPHPHDQHCAPDCDEDHSLECDEWLWNDEELHGQEHRYVSDMLCIRDSGCWMPHWGIEFDNPQSLPPGVYDFDYEDPDDDMGGTLYIVAMRPADD